MTCAITAFFYNVDIFLIVREHLASKHTVTLANDHHASVLHADCQCGSEVGFVCAFGLTFQSKCDADCGGYTCPQTPGVCAYRADTSSGQLVTPRARSAPGGAPYSERCF